MTTVQASTSAKGTVKPEVHEFFHDGQSNTLCYLVKDPTSPAAMIIDAPADIVQLPNHRELRYDFVKSVLQKVDELKDCRVDYVVETHVHADHISAAPWVANELARRQGVKPKIAIGANVTVVQDTFKKVYHLTDADVASDGSQFDVLWGRARVQSGRLAVQPGELIDEFQLGSVPCKVLWTPGHTPACCTYVIGDSIFCGDTLFHVDKGSARCDFPGGSAADMYKSCRSILQQPDDFRVWICHDYPANPDSAKAGERTEHVSMQTVAQHKEFNIHFNTAVSEEEYVKLRSTRDAVLSAPKALHPSLRCNIQAGNLPPARSTIVLPHHVDKVKGVVDADLCVDVVSS